jgi:hypothetical protein
MNVPKPVNVKCGRERCTCILPQDQALLRDGQYFCSEACRDGGGCDHAGCACAAAAVAGSTEPAPRRAEGE